MLPKYKMESLYCLSIFGLNVSKTPKFVNCVSRDEKSSLYIPPQLKVSPFSTFTEDISILYFSNSDHSLSEKSSPTTPIKFTFVNNEAATPKYVDDPPNIFCREPLQVVIESNAIDPTATISFK